MITASAAIEQMSKGQIGQPAACIIENNMALSYARVGDPRTRRARIMACGPRALGACCGDFVRYGAGGSIPLPFLIHWSRGQLCGQPGGAVLRRQQRRAADRIAEELSSEKAFQINHLLRQCTTGKGISLRRANAGAAVELSSRARLAFADA